MPPCGNYEGILHILLPRRRLIRRFGTFCRPWSIPEENSATLIWRSRHPAHPGSPREPGDSRYGSSPSLTFIRPRRASSASAPCCRTTDRLLPGRRAAEPALRRICRGADWLFHEAFCLYRDREIFSPFMKNTTAPSKMPANSPNASVRGI